MRTKFELNAEDAHRLNTDGLEVQVGNGVTVVFQMEPGLTVTVGNGVVPTRSFRYPRLKAQAPTRLEVPDRPTSESRTTRSLEALIRDHSRNARYSEAIKQAVLDDRRPGESLFKLARRHKLTPTVVIRWVKKPKGKGLRRTHAVEFKQAVIREAAATSMAAVSKKYHLGRGLVRHWVLALKKEGK